MKPNKTAYRIKKPKLRPIRLAMLICATSLCLTACTLTMPGKGTWTLEPLGNFNLHFGRHYNGNATNAEAMIVPACDVCGNAVRK